MRKMAYLAQDETGVGLLGVKNFHKNFFLVPSFATEGIMQQPNLVLLEVR